MSRSVLRATSVLLGILLSGCTAKSPTRHWSSIELRPDAGVMSCGDARATLAPAEMQMMLLLVRNHRDVVRRGALEAAAWGPSEAVTPNALDVALHRIRRKLVALGSRQRIVNVRGLGYALRADDVAA